MNNTQRALLAVYLPLTGLFLFLDNLYPSHPIVSYSKYATIISLFLVSLVLRKCHTEQKIVSFALFFVVVADFFLVFCSTLPQLAPKVVPLGIAGFMLAYLLLILVYQKNFRITKKEGLALLVVAAIFAPVYLTLAKYVTGPLFIGTAIFGLVLCYMTWTLICTLFRGYYNPASARLIALSGILIFVSDLAVAHALFNPAYANTFVPWLKNITWICYIPAWCLQAMLVAEEKLILPK